MNSAFITADDVLCDGPCASDPCRCHELPECSHCCDHVHPADALELDGKLVCEPCFDDGFRAERGAGASADELFDLLLKGAA